MVFVCVMCNVHKWIDPSKRGSFDLLSTCIKLHTIRRSAVRFILFTKSTKDIFWLYRYFHWYFNLFNLLHFIFIILFLDSHVIRFSPSMCYSCIIILSCNVIHHIVVHLSSQVGECVQALLSFFSTLQINKCIELLFADKHTTKPSQNMQMREVFHVLQCLRKFVFSPTPFFNLLSSSFHPPQTWTAPSHTLQTWTFNCTHYLELSLCLVHCVM